MLKRYILSILLLSISIFSHGQTLNGLFYEFSKASNVECVNLSPLLMSLLRPVMMTHDMEGMKVRSLQVLDLSSCNPSVKENYSRKALQIDDERYEPMIMVNDKEEAVRIYVKGERGIIREFVVLTTGNDPAFVRIKGYFTMSDMEKICNNKKYGR